MRLIDADLLNNILYLKNDNIWINIDDILKIISNQPTAYDINNVINRLNEESYTEDCCTIRIIELDDAINIIKNEILKKGSQ